MDWDAVEQEGELRDIFYDEREVYVEGAFPRSAVALECGPR
jgi:hypothetical protein